MALFIYSFDGFLPEFKSLFGHADLNRLRFVDGELGGVVADVLGDFH